MRVEVLGPVRLSTDEGTVIEVAERKLRLLLAALVAADGEPVSADVLIDRLWDARLPADPRKVLRAKLSHLRAALDRAHPEGRRLLTHTPGGYRLILESGTVDAERFTTAVERARRLVEPGQQADALRAAMQLWRGEPYGDLADEFWLAPAVTALKDQRGEATERLVEALVEGGRPEQAIDLTANAVRAYPTREGLVATSMLALYRLGRQQESIELFESLRHRLAEELGVDPGPQVRELHGRILRQEPALTPEPSPQTTARAGPVRSNLPTETTPLFGRRRELDEIGALVSESRLVTLTGIGGVGKTRLAVRLAHEQEAQLERGAWLIDLTELVRTPEGQARPGDRVAALTVRVLDLPERLATASDVDRLGAAWGASSVLLVLDNCEHVVVEVAAFVAELLRKAPGVQVLATSREPLGLPEEHRYDIVTLNTEPSETGAASEAVEFFAARARATDPTVHLDETTIPAVAELCRRLDGLPLALELAAARIRGISVRDLLERIGDRLNILHRPGRRAPRRQQTLRGMIDWSWSLLDASERAVLRRLALHPGSMALAAVEEICADGPADAGGVGPTQVVDVLIGLVDRSMVRTVSTPTGVRYGLLESIATFAAEKLDDAGEREGVARRHLRYHLELAREADRHLRGPGQRRWLARLEADRAQLRNAFETAVRTADGGSAVALTVATFWHQWIFGRHSTLKQDLGVATGLPGPRTGDIYAVAATLSICMGIDDQPDEAAERVAGALGRFSDDVARARVQWFAGTALLAVGVREAGERHVDEASAILLAAGEDWDVAVAACQRDWFIVSIWGESPRGLPDGRDPETVLRALGDGYGLLHVFDVEHRLAEIEGDHLRAADAANRALEVCLDFELWGEASYWHAATAMAALRSGELAEATQHVARARSLASDVAGAEPGARFADLAELMIARHAGDLRRARALLERWVPMTGLDTLGEPGARLELGFLAVQLTDLALAQEAYRAVHPRIARRAKPPVIARVLELAAAIRALREEPVMAAELLGTAAAVREEGGVPAPATVLRDVDRVRAMVHEHVTPQEAAEAFQRGRGLDPGAQLTAMALGP